MQILMFIRTFQTQRLWKIVAINAMQCLVRYNVHFSVWTGIAGRNSLYADNDERILQQTC